MVINGAGGGVGTFAVQLARYFGAEVTAVDSSAKLDMLRSIGADHVVDYRQRDYTRTGQRYDLILDAVANRSIREYRRALTPGGSFVMVGGPLASLFQIAILGSLMTLTGNRRMGLLMWKPNKREDLESLNDLLQAGRIMPVIDRRYPLAEIAEACRYLGDGHARGKVVIDVAANPTPVP